MNFTKNHEQTTFVRLLSASVIGLVSLVTIFAFTYAVKIKTHYSPKQFQPAQHQLLESDQKIRSRFQLDGRSPHVVLLSLPKEQSWLDENHFQQLEKLVKAYKEISGIESVTSLANVETALVQDDNFYVGRLSELFQNETEGTSWIKEHPLLVPRLLSKSNRHTAVVVTPNDMSIGRHRKLMNEIKTFAQVYAPAARIQVGGPAAIRTEIATMLSKEVLVFVVLSLLGALFILSMVFRGWTAVPSALFVVVAANTIALGIMSYLGLTFSVLSTTLPIIVTITVVAISTHSMVKLGEDLAKGKVTNKFKHLLKTMKELALPHMLTALTTMVGFGTLFFSEVPLIREYGLTIACAVPFAAIITLISLPALMIWFPIPATRDWLENRSRFADFVSNYKTPLFAAVIVVFGIMFYHGKDLQWTSRMFDDLPRNNEARRSTFFMNKYLGGVIPLEFSVGHSKANGYWKQIEHIERLDKLTAKWERMIGVGSTTGLNHLVKVADPNYNLPNSSAAVSETFFVYGMSPDNPLKNFVSPSYNFTRININFRDIPANKMQRVIRYMKRDLQKNFPELETEVGGIAATIHPLNEILSKDLMLGFFYAMFWIMLLLTLVFNSWRWAAVAAIPNMVPPCFLMGALAITKTPIKPSIAIIFAISLGIAFDNTVYILGRLKQMLKEKVYTKIPVNELLRSEANPCFVTSFSLFAGFSIFLFSYFNVNKQFGLFMLLSILAGLIGDLILLPTVLKIFPNILGQKSKNFGLGNLLKEENLVKSVSLLIAGLATLLLVYSPTLDAKGLSANGILSKVEKMSSPPNEATTINMSITEPDGTKKNRKITILRKNSDAQRAMVRIHEPNDLKGVSLLSVNSGDSEDQWLYLPSSKRTRRIMGSGKKGRFLDSDLSYEDMRVSTYKTYKNKIIKTSGKGKKKYVIIESKNKGNNDSSYGKIKTWISLKHYRILKSEYYGKDGKLAKTMTFKKYKRYGKKFWRAREVVVKNVKDKRKTKLILNQVSLKNLDDEEFSKSALEEGV